MTTPTPDAGDTHPHADDHGHDESHHRSGWPIVSAVGAALLYVGVGLLALAYSVETVPAPVGFVVASLGIIGLVVGLAGWFGQAFVQPRLEHYTPDTDHAKRELYVTTMVLFLFTDLSTFAAGFIYFAFIRVGTWPPAELPPLLGSLVVINTAILILSSITYHGAHVSLERGNQRLFQGLLGVTLLLGTIFLLGQGYEYYEFIVLEGFGLTDGIYASAFYGLTGLHGLHVALGVLLIGLVFVRARRGTYTPEQDTGVSTVGLYWHFVDAVWIFLVIVLYVGAAI